MKREIAERFADEIGGEVVAAEWDANVWGVQGCAELFWELPPMSMTAAQRHTDKG